MVVVCYWSVSCKSSEKRKLLKFLIKNDMNVKMNDVQLCTDKKCITNTAVFHKKINKNNHFRFNGSFKVELSVCTRTLNDNKVGLQHSYRGKNTCELLHQ